MRNIRNGVLFESSMCELLIMVLAVSILKVLGHQWIALAIAIISPAFLLEGILEVEFTQPSRWFKELFAAKFFRQIFKVNPCSRRNQAEMEVCKRFINQKLAELESTTSNSLYKDAKWLGDLFFKENVD